MRALVFLGWVTLLVAPLAAQGFPPHIEVTGEGEVRRVPDQAVVTLGVETWAVDLSEARKENDGRMAQLLAVPPRFAIDSRDVKTDYASIEPQYDLGDHGQVRSIGGYRVTKVVTITVKQLDQLEALVTAALGAGANRLDRVAYGLADPSKAQEEARILAVRRAKSQAEGLAAELGTGLGRPLLITDSSGGGAQGPMFKTAFLASDRGMSEGGTFAPGLVIVSAQVHLWFQLKD